MFRSLMLSCEDFRLRAGAEPTGGGFGRRMHRWMCAACRRYEQEMSSMDARLRSAIRRPPAGAADDDPPPGSNPPPPR